MWAASSLWDVQRKCHPRSGRPTTFPDDTYKEGARIFPSLVPFAPDNPSSDANRRAWKVLSSFSKPFLTAFSDGDPITAGGDKVFQKLIPGVQG